MTTPFFVGVGAPSIDTIGIGAPGASGLTLLDNDILLCVAQTSSQEITITAGGGGTWTELPGSPIEIGAAATDGSVRLTAWWSRYSSAAGQNQVQLSDPGDHTGGPGLLAFRGCVITGTPFDAGGSGTETADTSAAIPGGTATVPETLVVALIGVGQPFVTPGAWANADLAGVAQIFNGGAASGLGSGSFGVVGSKSLAGAYGTTTSTLDLSVQKAMISIALKPPLGPGRAAVGVSGSRTAVGASGGRTRVGDS